MSTALSEIIDYLELPDTPIEEIVDGSKVKKWLANDDIDVLGAAYALIPDKLRFSNISPPIQFNDFVEFIKYYFGRCFIENPDSEWAHSQYEAGRDLVGWFLHIWDDGVDKKIIDDIKDWLRDLYVNGDEELKICLVHATIEHIFERKDILKYFEDWKSDPDLRRAYNEAIQWSQKKQ